MRPEYQGLESVLIPSRLSDPSGFFHLGQNPIVARPIIPSRESVLCPRRCQIGRSAVERGQFRKFKAGARSASVPLLKLN